MRTKSLCYIADMVLPIPEQRVCGAMRMDSAGTSQRLAVADITYGYGNMQQQEHIVEDILRQTPTSKRCFAESANIITRIMGGIQGVVSFGAIYMCGKNACHVTTGNEVMNIVRDGKMINAAFCGIFNDVRYHDGIFCYTFRLKKNDTVFLHRKDVYDIDVRKYICSLVSMNLKRRSVRLAYKSNAEVLDEICSVIRLKGGGHIDGAFTVITCFADV